MWTASKIPAKYLSLERGCVHAHTSLWACVCVKSLSQECVLCFVLLLSRVMNKSGETSVGYKILWLLPHLPSVNHSCCLPCLLWWTSADKLWAGLWEGTSQWGTETLIPTTSEELVTVIWMILDILMNI